ncbi:hypothetical protein [Methylorubrum aminovorans]|uniref:PD-(D/E)XK nuclease domain-containing protein n=1 Tax=Methylorubrum aminovorans TaxID=269069 RepID=UPI003C2B2A82
MNEAKYLDRAREAGLYLQKFVRSKHDDFAEAFREMHPNQGWNGKGVREAHNAVAMLYHFTDEKFLNCRIPEDYGSPAALRSAVVELQGMMSVLKKEIENIKPSKKEFLAETVPIAHEHIEATLFAAEETLRQLDEAAFVLPSDPSSISAAITPSSMETIYQIANRFPDVVARLKKRRKGRSPLIIGDEYDVQYLFQALLSVPFLDVRPEEPTPSVAGGTGRADTLLKAENIVIEYKCARDGLGDKELRKQIADDFLLYGKHVDCKKLVVFVYDSNQHVPNPEGFENDLTVKVEGLDSVHIIIRR